MPASPAFDPAIDDPGPPVLLRAGAVEE